MVLFWNLWMSLRIQIFSLWGAKRGSRTDGGSSQYLWTSRKTLVL